MPRVKVDYIVSFSSEDPEHPASNLLAWELSKKKWLCKKGESSCSVVLQLTKAVKISSVHIGAYHSALVEVLVARSEKANDQYQVLVPSCVLVSPAESRRDEPVERVRSFSAEQLAADARLQRWDRVRVVCSQPYNKHCKYGLSFIHIDEPGEDVTVTKPQLQPAATSIPKRVLALDTFSSDEDDFRPGELFAKHLQKNSDSQSSSSDTGAQIRQATSQALKNISESSTKLMKTPINKPSNKRDTASTSAEGSGRSDRSRDTLLYTNDDERPHTKIDQVLQRHKEQKEKEDKSQMKVNRPNGSSQRHKEEKQTPKRRKSSSPSASETPPSKRAHKNPDNSSDRKKRDDKRSKPGSEDSEQEGEECSEPHTILSGVVMVLSGYENPQRAHVRNTALALGAQVQRDWGPSCTHLVCAFPNTPKLRAVRAAPGGNSVPVVAAEWVLHSAATRRRLPWRWFATEPHHRRQRPTAPPAPPAPPPASTLDTDCDTDDEIEKVLQKQKAKQIPISDDKRVKSPQPSPPPTMDVEEGPTTDEDTAEEPAVAKFGGALPNFFDGYTFAIDDEHSDAEQLSRYIKAYGGLTLQLSEVEEDSCVDFVLEARAPSASASAGRGARPRRVSAAWLARCHRAQALLPPLPPLPH